MGVAFHRKQSAFRRIRSTRILENLLEYDAKSASLIKGNAASNQALVESCYGGNEHV
jgi:hypothetical protein